MQVSIRAAEAWAPGRLCLVMSLVAAGVMIPATSNAQRVIEGVVVDSSGAPVSYANVIAAGSLRRVAADADGRFRIGMDSSAKRLLEVRRIGYHPLSVSLEPWPDTAMRLVMAAATRTLSTVTVAVERSAALAIHGFYERMNDVERGINRGYFITPEDIEVRKGSKQSDLMTGLPSIRVRWVKTGDGRAQSSAYRWGWEVQGNSGCEWKSTSTACG